MIFSRGECTKCFTKKKGLQRHLWKCTQDCSIVNCKYFTITIIEPDLQDHINCHHANKLYEGKFCQRSLTNKRNCDTHKRQVRLAHFVI